MRTLAIAIAALVILTTDAAWAQGRSMPPTRVCEVGRYVCPDHGQIQATWPARCPICGLVLAAAPGDGTAGAAGGMGAAVSGTTGVRTQSPGVAGRAQGGVRAGPRTFGRQGSADRRSQQFRQTPEQQFRQRFPETPEQQFRQQFPQTPEQQFRQQFPRTPEQRFGQRFPQTPDQQFGQRFPQTPEQRFRWTPKQLFRQPLPNQQSDQEFPDRGP